MDFQKSAWLCAKPASSILLYLNEMEKSFSLLKPILYKEICACTEMNSQPPSLKKKLMSLS